MSTLLLDRFAIWKIKLETTIKWLTTNLKTYVTQKKNHAINQTLS